MYTFIEGKSHNVGTEAETLELVRGVLTEVEEPEEQRPSNFRQAAQAKSMRKERARKAKLFAPLPTPEGDTAAKKAFRMPSLGKSSGLAQAGLSRIKRKHVLLAAFIALAIWKPMWIVFTALFIACLIGLAFYFAGGEKIWRGVMLALHDLSDKDPHRAVRLRARLDRFAVKWDAFLDRFPDGTVDGLYLPDFQILSQDEARNEKLLAERLQRLASEF